MSRASERWEVVWCNHPWIDYPNNGEKRREFHTEAEARMFRDTIKGKPETAWTTLRPMTNRSVRGTE